MLFIGLPSFLEEPERTDFKKMGRGRRREKGEQSADGFLSFEGGRRKRGRRKKMSFFSSTSPLTSLSSLSL